MEFLFVSELARRLGIKPRIPSDLFYDRAFDEELCPVVAGRRVIPAKYVPTIMAVLHKRGLIPARKPVVQ